MSAANGHGSSAGASAHNGCSSANGNGGGKLPHGWFCTCRFCLMQGVIQPGH